MLDGATLREIDMRRSMLEQAVNIANISNSEHPKKAFRNGYRAIEKSENRVLNHQDSRELKRPKIELIQKVNEAFGGDANV